MSGISEEENAKMLQIKMLQIIASAPMPPAAGTRVTREELRDCMRWLLNPDININKKPEKDEDGTTR